MDLVGHDFLTLLDFTPAEIGILRENASVLTEKILIFFIILRFCLIQALNIVFSVPTGLVLPPFLRYNRLSF